MSVGIIHKLVQLQKNGTTAKQIVHLQTKMHNCETHLLHLYIFGNNYDTTFPYPYLFPRSHATQQRPSRWSCHQQSPRPLLESRHVIFLLLLCSLAFKPNPSASCAITGRGSQVHPNIGATGCTLTVGTAGGGLVGAGKGVLGLRPRGSLFTLAKRGIWAASLCPVKLRREQRSTWFRRQ